MDDAANLAASMATLYGLHGTANFIRDQAARIEALEARIAKADARVAKLEDAGREAVKSCPDTFPGDPIYRKASK